MKVLDILPSPWAEAIRTSCSHPGFVPLPAFNPYGMFYGGWPQFGRQAPATTLDMPIVISNKVGPVCLPPASTDPDQYVDKDGAVMGWCPTTPSVTAFKQGKVTIGSVADCKGETTYGKYVTADATICIATGSPAVTCPTEIGGPVVINTAPATAGAAPVWTIVGINSYTPDDACGGSTFKNGLKTRVSAFSSWITTYLNRYWLKQKR